MPVSGGGLCRSVAAFLGQDSKVTPLTPYPLAPSGTPYPLAGGTILGQDSTVDLDHAAPQTPLTRCLSRNSSSASGTREAPSRGTSATPYQIAC